MALNEVGIERLYFICDAVQILIIKIIVIKIYIL